MFSFRAFSSRGRPERFLRLGGRVQLLLSPAILEEYQRVLCDLAVGFPGIEVEVLLDFLTLHSEIVIPKALSPVIQADHSDDKFLECAVTGKAICIVSGDNHLLKLLKFRGISILKPREFIDDYLGPNRDRTKVSG